MKKLTKIAFLLSSASMVLAVSAGILFGANKNGLFSLNANEREFELLFDEKQPAPGLVTTDAEYNDTNYNGIGDFNRFDVTTKDGNGGLNFFYKSAFKNDSGYIALGYNGGFGNSYLKDAPNHGRITGLKRLVVNFTGGKLTANYSYEDDMALGNYRVTSQPIQSGVAYNFDNNYPCYFSINTEINVNVYIQSISVIYSCSNALEKLPKLAYYDPGFHVGVTQEHLNKSFKATAKSATEAIMAIEEAIVRHYRTVEVKFDYEPIEEADVFIYRRYDFSHCDLFPINYSTVKGSVNTFGLYYGNDIDFNNDEFLNNLEQSGKPGLENHFNVAQFYTNLTPENYTDCFLSANKIVRFRYAKEQGLHRPKDFNDFAIDKLDASREFPVYNSEDLWWAAAHDYKPVFPLANSKAEWIYNKAKSIVRENIYNGMTDFEKLRAIYEWIINNNQYDHDALNSSRTVYENVCFYLEGVFERHIAVCDSFSKTFVLLAKIEGLDVLRGLGFGSAGGHAWAYARTNPSEPYYLICPTWGNSNLTYYDKNDVKRRGRYLDYSAFMTKSTFFFDKSGGDMSFDDAINEEQNLSTEIYSPSIYTLDKLPGYETEGYDYQVDSQEELTAIVKQAANYCGNYEFTISVTYSGVDATTFQNWFDIAVEEARPLFFTNYSIYQPFTKTPLYGVSSTHLIFSTR